MRIFYACGLTGFDGVQHYRFKRATLCHAFREIRPMFPPSYALIRHGPYCAPLSHQMMLTLDTTKLQLEPLEKLRGSTTPFAGNTKPCVKCAQTTTISRLVAGRHSCANLKHVRAYKLRRVRCQPGLAHDWRMIGGYSCLQVDCS